MLVDSTSGAGFSFGEKLPSTYATTIFTQQPNALDVVGGGTYSALAANVSLDGSASRTWTWGSNIDQIHNGSNTFNGQVSIGAAINMLFSDTSTMTMNGDMTLTNLGSMAVQGKVTLGTNGGIRERWYNKTSDADETVDINTYDAISQGATLTTTRTIKLSNTGAAAGDVIWVVNQDTGNNIEVDDNSDVNLAVLVQTVGSTYAACFRHNGTDWKLFFVVKA